MNKPVSFRGVPLPPRPHPPQLPDPKAHFAPATLARFADLVKPYPDSRAALIPMLHAAQEEKGWLSNETLAAVAAYLKLPPIRVYEVASFYPMFHLRPVGKHVAWVCRNIACDLRGARALVDVFHRKCGIRPGETTQDGLLTLQVAECLGACTAAPMMDLDGVYHENLDPKRVEALLDRLS